MVDAQPPGGTGQGPATDAQNAPVVDPSKNVLDLVDAGNKRQDDLREADGRHIREILALRAEAGARDRQCGEELADQASKHLHEVADIRARHGQELRRAEAERINAIRTVDVEAVQRAAEVQQTQQGVLAGQVQAAAEAMRTQVTAATTAATQNQAAALEPITKAIEDLRRSQYEAQGQKTQVVETQGKGANVALWAGLAVAVFVGLVGMVIGIITVVVLLTSGGPS